MPPHNHHHHAFSFFIPFFLQLSFFISLCLMLTLTLCPTLMPTLTTVTCKFSPFLKNKFKKYYFGFGFMEMEIGYLMFISFLLFYKMSTSTSVDESSVIGSPTFSVGNWMMTLTRLIMLKLMDLPLMMKMMN